MSSSALERQKSVVERPCCLGVMLSRSVEVCECKGLWVQRDTVGRKTFYGAE